MGLIRKNSAVLENLHKTRRKEKKIVKQFHENHDKIQQIKESSYHGDSNEDC